MASVLVGFIFQAAPMAAIVYALTWLALGRRNGVKLQVGGSRHGIGVLTVAVLTGLARFAIGFVFGGATMGTLWTNQGTGLIGPVGLPLVFSIVAAAHLRARSATVAT